MSHLECSHLTDPKMGKCEFIGSSILSGHPLPPSATLCLVLLLNSLKNQAGDTLFHMFLKVYKTCELKRRSVYISGTISVRFRSSAHKGTEKLKPLFWRNLFTYSLGLSNWLILVTRQCDFNDIK